MACGPFEAMHDLRGRERRREVGAQMHVIGTHHQLDNLSTERGDQDAEDGDQAIRNRAFQHSAPVFRAPDEMIGDLLDGVPCSFSLHERIIQQLACQRLVSGREGSASSPA